MSAPPERLRLVRQWVEKAEEDLKAAERLLPLEEDFSSVISFHAQQCAEKFIKALLVERGIPFPRIHDIGDLIQLLPAEIRPSIDVMMQERLTHYATVSRYPGDVVISREDLEAAVAAARKVREAVLNSLPKAVVQDLL